jgi:multidrug efflux system membrane fusion protein
MTVSLFHAHSRVFPKLVQLASVVFAIGMIPTHVLAQEAPPPPSVEIVTVKSEQIRVWTSYSGRLAAVDIAEIKPQVSGEITKVLFADGQQVKKGAQLFEIDPRPYQAELNKMKAQVATAKSRAKLAKDELDRKQTLVKNKLVSESIYDIALNEYEVATVSINEAESALEETKLNLDYAYIKAPFDGQISRAELTVGNVVDANVSTPVLATIVSNDKVYAEFNVDETTYIKARREQADPTTMPVQLTLSDDPSFVYYGHIHSFDNQLDVSSGTIRARAVFDNTDGVLAPGMFAHVKLGSTNKKEVLLIPSKAIGTNQDKKFVFIVDNENKAVYRQVTLGVYHQDSRVVTSGLEHGDRVITNGLAHVRPNSVVAPVSEDTDTQAP